MNTSINTPTAAETALINLINDAIENGRANIGNVEARVHGGRVRLFMDSIRTNKTQVLEILTEVTTATMETENIRHAQNLFDNERARAIFCQDVQQAINNAANGLTAWSLHKIMTTVLGWTGFAQRSPEMSANLFYHLSQETGLLRYAPAKRGTRTVKIAEIV